MTMAGFKMDFVADVRSFLRGTSDVEGALDKVSDSLDDLARDAQQSADKTGDAFDDAGKAVGDSLDDGAKEARKSLDRVGDDAKDAAKEVDDAAEKMERSFRDAFDAAKKESKTVRQDIGDDAKKGFSDAGEATETFKNEARQNLSETVSSFRGDTEDLAQIAQDVLGGVVSDLGPIGMVAGAAAAAGIGMAVAKLQDMAEKINAAKEEAGELAIEFKNAGGRIEELDLVGKFDEWLVAIEDSRQWFEVWQDDAVTNLDNVRTAIEGTGISLGDLYNAFSKGDTSTLEEYVDRLKEVNKELVPDGHVANTQAQNDEFQARKNTIAGLEEEIEKRKDAEDLAYKMRAAEEGVTEESLRQADALAGINAQIREKNDLTRESISADLDFEDALVGLAGTQDGWSATLDKSTQLGRDNQRSIIDATGDLNALGDATLEQTGSQEEANKVLAEGKQRLIDQAVAAGYDRTEVQGLIEKIISIPKTATTDFDVNTVAARAELEEFIRIANQRQIVIQARVDADPSYSPATSSSSIRRAKGGIIPGVPSSQDNVNADLAMGEYVVNSDATAKNRQLLDAINEGRQPVLPQSSGAPTSVSLEGANVTINVEGASFRGYVEEVSHDQAVRVVLEADRNDRATRSTRGRQW